jgi:hypothetical protein|tara:strand:+ start:253 stop:498 length:246 start_codon:yes stop_codon:yes gene_type:complete
MPKEPEDKEIKVVGEYLQFLQEGVQYSLDLHSSLLQIVGDFAHDQGHAWDRLMDSLGNLAVAGVDDDSPYLTVVPDENEEG